MSRGLFAVAKDFARFLDAVANPGDQIPKLALRITVMATFVNIRVELSKMLCFRPLGALCYNKKGAEAPFCHGIFKFD